MFGYVDLVVFIGILGAVAYMLPSALTWNQMAFTSQVAQLEAGQLATITDAALEYEYGNMASLDAPNSTHTVTVATLIAQGFLPTGTKATDEFGNPVSVIFTADASGNVTGYVRDQGSKIYSDQEAGQLMLALGDRGGYVPAVRLGSQLPGVIYGAGDTWQVGAPAGIAAGSIEVKVEPNAAQEADNSKFLWRVPAPTSSENTMTTPLIMAATETEGSSCPYTGAIAQDGTGALVSCEGGLWTAAGGGHWKTPVSTYGSLPGGGNQVGDVRLTEDTDRAFAWNGGAWTALAVDQNGNLTVPHQLSVDSGHAQILDNGSGAELALSDSSGNSYASIYNASYGSVLDLRSNTGTTYSTAAESGSLNVWTNANGGASPVLSIQGNGEWDSEYGNNFCFNGAGNGSYDCNGGWGLQPRYGSGWSMVTSVNGSLNAQPENAPGSIHANDYYDRATGWWFSQAVSQIQANQSNISSLQSTVANQGNQIANNRNNINYISSALSNPNVCSGTPYAALSTICSDIQSSGGAYFEQFGPETQTSYQSCGWQYNRWYGWTYTCWWSSGPASASGRSGIQLTADGSAVGGVLPNKPLLITVTAIVGGNNNSDGANWGGLNEPCSGGGGGVGADLMAWVNGVQVADLAVSKSAQPDYISFLSTENTATFLVPAGWPFSIQASSTCVQFRGVIWTL